MGFIIYILLSVIYAILQRIRALVGSARLRIEALFTADYDSYCKDFFWYVYTINIFDLASKIFGNLRAFW
jgi:hypothetical protein